MTICCFHAGRTSLGVDLLSSHSGCFLISAFGPSSIFSIIYDINHALRLCLSL